MKKCEVCGTAFYMRQDQGKKGFERQKCCSVECGRKLAAKKIAAKRKAAVGGLEAFDTDQMSSVDKFLYR